MIEIELFVKYILWARREQFGYDKQNWIIFMCVAEPKKKKQIREIAMGQQKYHIE